MPLQLCVVSVLPGGHELLPQLVVLLGKMHAPVAVQSVAPHAPPIGLHAATQQWVPVPAVPQTLLEHWSLAVQAAPAAPLATQLPPEQ